MKNVVYIEVFPWEDTGLVPFMPTLCVVTSISNVANIPRLRDELKKLTPYFNVRWCRTEGGIELDQTFKDCSEASIDSHGSWYWILTEENSVRDGQVEAMWNVVNNRTNEVKYDHVFLFGQVDKNELLLSDITRGDIELNPDQLFFQDETMKDVVGLKKDSIPSVETPVVCYRNKNKESMNILLDKQLISNS
jgi:hypothetical protein